MTLARRCSAVAARAALPALLLFAFGCATSPAREPPPARSARTEETVAQARQDLEQVIRRLDAVASRSDDLENALARFGARIEALERRVEHLGALLAHARASSSPSAAPPTPSARVPGSGPPSPPSSAPGSGPPGEVAQSPRGLAAAPGGPTTTAEELYQAGVAKFRAKELDAAVLIFYDLITSYPSHPIREDAQFLVGDIFFSQKDLRGALREFEELLTQAPNGTKTAEALLKIGLCHRGLGDQDSARRTWQRLIREHPDSVAARQARVLLRGSGRR